MTKTATHAWVMALEAVMNTGSERSPRGLTTVEVPHRTDVVDMRHCLVQVPARGLNYRFAAAEAYWILTGDNHLASLLKYNSHMAKFSDDGETLFGAYGPPIQAQLDYVVGKLLRDPDTRQAALTIWRPNPQPTKDVPCTVAMVFALRDSLLNAHVFMRSSDLWLGWPYDVFSFSMVAHQICCRLNTERNFDGQSVAPVIEPGNLYLTAASSHLYAQDWEGVTNCLTSPKSHGSTATPPELFVSESKLLERLRLVRDTSPGNPLRWWEPKVTLDGPEPGREAA